MVPYMLHPIERDNVKGPRYNLDQFHAGLCVEIARSF